MEELQCHFCNGKVPYPEELDTTCVCSRCRTLYAGVFPGDVEDIIFDLVEELCGEFILNLEEISAEYEQYIQRGVDTLYDNAKQADKRPEEGVKVTIVWVRKKPVQS